MPAKKNPKTTKTTKSEKKIVKRAEKKTEKKEKSGLKKGLEKNLKKTLILQNNIKLAKEDKMLEKVEEYVDKNREKTSQEMLERKSKRPVNKYQEADLEVMISRI
jgi:phosphoenolpyruvate-protein kinase (PTS system EI component)